MHPRKYVHLSLLISEFTLFVMMITIFSIGLIFNNKKEFVWIGSKILTLKQMLEDNMYNNYPLISISKDNENPKFVFNYEYLLNHSTKDKCEDNFHKCGILDTFGNIMCIHNVIQCPINDIIVDLKDNLNIYINKGYDYTKFPELPQNYYLYYTNKEIDKEIIVYLNINDEQPRYISPQNFIFDNNTYDKYLVSHYSSGDGSSWDYGGGGDYGGDSGGGGGDSGGIGDGGGYWRILEEEEELYGNKKLTKYIRKKFNEKKNIDIYYKKIYNNIYVKNYIGFESYEHMINFMNEDLLHLYLKIIPNYASTIISIICALVLLVLMFFSICRLCYKDIPNDHGDESCITCSKLVVGGLYFIIFSGYYIYFNYAYCKIYKNPKFIKIKQIKSDNFIKDFIKEISKGKNKSLILSVITILSFSFIFFIITWIFKPFHQMYLKSLGLEIKINNEKPNDLNNKDSQTKKYFESSDTKPNNKELKDFQNINEKMDEKNNMHNLGNKDLKGETNKENNLKENSTRTNDSDIAKQ